MAATYFARAGRTLWLALLATLASVPLATAVAAWSAAVRVIRSDDGTGTTGRWFAELRRSVRATAALSLLCSMLGIAAVADLAYALLLDAAPLRYPVLAVGGALTVMLLAVGPFLVTTHATTAATGMPLVRSALLLSGVRPQVTVPLILLGALTAVCCLGIPALAPAFLGLHLSATIRAHASAVATVLAAGARVIR